MIRCEHCAGALRQKRGNHRYVEANLPFVVLVNAVLLECAKCGSTLAVLPDPRILSVAIAAKLLSVLTPLPAPAIRYLRKAMKMTADELAFLLDTTRVQVSRWENGHAQMSGITELRFRREVADKLLPPTNDTAVLKEQIVTNMIAAQRSDKPDDIFVDVRSYYLQPFDIPKVETTTSVSRL